MNEPTDEIDSHPARAYAPELYNNLDGQGNKDNFDDFVNELEHYMIQLRQLFPLEQRALNALISSIWDNTRDLTGSD